MSSNIIDSSILTLIQNVLKIEAGYRLDILDLKEIVDTIVKSKVSGNPFDSSKTYKIGDIVTRNGILYESRISDNTGTFDVTDWFTLSLTDYVVNSYYYDKLLVINNGSLYQADFGTTTFQSTDFATELANGDWVQVTTMWDDTNKAFTAGVRQGNVGFFSVVLGAFNDSGDFVGNIASGDSSIAGGVESEATNFACIALGNNTHATGTAAVSFGSSTTASGNNSTVFGRGCEANDFNETVMGSYPIISTGSPNLWNLADSLLVIGNGQTTGARSNALKMLKNGNTTLNGELTATKFFVSALNSPPSSASDTGVAGEIRITSDYIYVCVASNTWKRVSISTWT